jgi:hypothetical protein
MKAYILRLYNAILKRESPLIPYIILFLDLFKNA